MKQEVYGKALGIQLPASSEFLMVISEFLMVIFIYQKDYLKEDGKQLGLVKINYLYQLVNLTAFNKLQIIDQTK